MATERHSKPIDENQTTLCRQIKIERRTLARPSFRANETTMIFSDFLANRKANACALVFIVMMQPLKQGEDLISILRFKTNTIVLH